MTLDMIGYLALTLNLVSMYSKGEFRLRVFSTIANLTYVVYGVLIGAPPLYIGCSIAVMIHLYRIFELRHVKKYSTRNSQR